MSFPRLLLAAALAGALASTAPAVVLAREGPRAFAAGVEVDGVDVEQVAELASGVPLRFTVFGSAQARAALHIDGVGRAIELRETEPGVYEGHHVIDARDAIRPDSRVTATLQRDGQAASAELEEPLLLEKRTLTWGYEGQGAAGGSGRASEEPAFRAASPVPPAISPTRPVVPSRPAPAPRADVCHDCARVIAVRAVEAPRGGPIGSAARGVAQAILGKEAGEAHNRRMLDLLDTIGGALGGRPTQPLAPLLHYEVVLRLADGSTLLRRYEQLPPFATGETIRIGPRPGRGAPVPTSL